MEYLKLVTEDGMKIYYDVKIPVRDGSKAYADAYCPMEDGVYPVIMTLGPYGKQQPFQHQTPLPWKRLCAETPEVFEDTTCRHLTWETVDPEKWTREGYVVIRVDSRGNGRTPGVVDPFSWQETEDFYDCIEWAGQQSWCNGKVGLLGISYFAVMQWNVASLNPPHLAAICPWEGSCDIYREQLRKGGILSGLGGLDGNWWTGMILPGQYGMGKRSFCNPVSGLYAGGDETFSERELEVNRINNKEVARLHETWDEWYQERTPKLEDIRVPLLSCGNWGGHNLHLRGNVEGYCRSSSNMKWLELHGGTHFTDFYKKEGYELQRKFFDYFLKGIENGWMEQPKVKLFIRHPYEKFTVRYEEDWPIKGTEWKSFFLHSDQQQILETCPERENELSFQAQKESVTFMTETFSRETEFTGPAAVKLFISSTVKDADLVLALRLIGPDGEEVTFQGASAPSVPLTMGWLRASHRKLDKEKTLPYRPWHTHDEIQYLEPFDIYELDIELLPTSIVVPPGFRLALTVQAHDWERSVSFQDDNWDQRPELYGGKTTIHSGPSHPSYLLLPHIRQRE